ncbi:MAG: aldo/keto reductase [bacterium]
MNRREFLYECGMGLAGAARLAPNALPKRLLGRTGMEVSILGLGTSHFHRLDENVCVSLVHAALDSGIDYLDTARAYGHGQTEMLLGKALRGQRRDRVALVSKTWRRTANAALDELAGSLQSLRTDYLDIWMIHDFRTEADWRALESPRGILAAARRARERGWIRWIGLCAHRNAPLVARALDTFPIDVVMLPAAPVVPGTPPMLPEILPTARPRNTGLVGMRIIAASSRSAGNPMDPAALRSALALPFATAVMEWEHPRELLEHVSLVTAGGLFRNQVA